MRRERIGIVLRMLAGEAGKGEIGGRIEGRVETDEQRTAPVDVLQRVHPIGHRNIVPGLRVGARAEKIPRCPSARSLRHEARIAMEKHRVGPITDRTQDGPFPSTRISQHGECLIGMGSDDHVIIGIAVAAGVNDDNPTRISLDVNDPRSQSEPVAKARGELLDVAMTAATNGSPERLLPVAVDGSQRTLENCRLGSQHLIHRCRP